MKINTLKCAMIVAGLMSGSSSDNPAVVVFVSGIGLIALGILMAVFRKPFGVGFWRLGEFICRRHSSGFTRSYWDMICEVYNESNTPRIFLLMGILSIIQGGLLLAIAWFTRNGG